MIEVVCPPEQWRQSSLGKGVMVWIHLGEKIVYRLTVCHSCSGLRWRWHSYQNSVQQRSGSSSPWRRPPSGPGTPTALSPPPWCPWTARGRLDTDLDREKVGGGLLTDRDHLPPILINLLSWYSSMLSRKLPFCGPVLSISTFSHVRLNCSGNLTAEGRIFIFSGLKITSSSLNWFSLSTG